jgi:hypothetical protein
MSSFFRDQTFPANWHRRSNAGTFDLIGADAIEVFDANPVPPGANNASGAYVTDALPDNTVSILPSPRRVVSTLLIAF